jgi:AcrR family transcriptional regulator
MDTVGSRPVRQGRAAPLAPEERRKAIVDAVIPLIIEHGDSVSTRQIAEAAGIAEGSIFRVFPDKSALLMAAAAETLNPSGAREELVAATEGVHDLHELVRVVAERMFERSEQVMAVLMALRSTVPHPASGQHPPGPPAFVVEAHQALLERLTAVFEPHRDQLRVDPERAALLLRTLVLGTRNPGIRAEDRLSPAEVADVLLHGICHEGER